jgi:hypothetical protein
MKRIVAIGGHVIKTAGKELLDVIEDNKVEMLIHNGASLFHDFQLSIDRYLHNSGNHSYKLSDLMIDPELNREASEMVWKWLDGEEAPIFSITQACYENAIPVLLFTAPGCDFWQLFKGKAFWGMLGERMYDDFAKLRDRVKKPFHYVCMGSAVIHPEVFIKAIAGIKHPEFTADVVDFLDMYRPRTRVAPYGTYYKMEHKEYLKKWLVGEL